MKRAIGLLIFGTVFGLAWCFGSGVSEFTQTAFQNEVQRLAEGIDFENTEEIRNFEGALRNSDVFRSYAAEIRTIWGDNFTDDQLIGQIAEDMRESQRREREMRILQERFASAEAWSARTLLEGVVLFDLEMQQHIRNELQQNLARAQMYMGQYIGRTFQYTGQVHSVRLDEWRGDNGLFNVHLTRRDGMTVMARFNRDQADSVLQLNTGDIITISGRCVRMPERATADLGRSWVDLEDSVIMNVVD